MDYIRAADILPQELIEQLQQYIDGAMLYIPKKLEEKKHAILNPKPRTSKAAGMKVLIAKAKEAGLTDEQIAEKLGLKLDE